MYYYLECLCKNLFFKILRDNIFWIRKKVKGYKFGYIILFIIYYGD